MRSPFALSSQSLADLDCSGASRAEVRAAGFCMRSDGGNEEDCCHATTLPRIPCFRKLFVRSDEQKLSLIPNAQHEPGILKRTAPRPTSRPRVPYRPSPPCCEICTSTASSSSSSSRTIRQLRHSPLLDRGRTDSGVSPGATLCPFTMKRNDLRSCSVLVAYASMIFPVCARHQLCLLAARRFSSCMLHCRVGRRRTELGGRLDSELGLGALLILYHDLRGEEER